MWLLAAFAASLLAWLQLPELTTLVRLWTVVLLVPFTVLSVVQARELRQLTTLPRRAAYISTIISLWALAIITAIVSHLDRMSTAALGFFATTPGALAAWTAAATVAGVGTLFLFRMLGVRDPPIVRELMPQTRSDRALFAFLSLTAGVSEEFIFRGFLLAALGMATTVPALPLVLSSGAFAVVHAYQQPLGALRAGVLGVVLAVPLLCGQPIYASILAHTFIDLLAGLWLSRYLLR